jgi:putative SOS response-associated peptidase YedK
MCGRFVMDIIPELLPIHFGLAAVPDIRASYNVAQIQTMAMVRLSSDHLNLSLMKWGVVSSWAKAPAIGSSARRPALLCQR